MFELLRAVANFKILGEIVEEGTHDELIYANGKVCFPQIFLSYWVKTAHLWSNSSSTSCSLREMALPNSQNSLSSILSIPLSNY